MYALVSSLQLIRGQSWTVKTSKMKVLNFITNCVDFAFSRFSMIFTFPTICNKLFKLEVPKEFPSICTCSFITINEGTQLYSLDIKIIVFELYYKLREVCVLTIFDYFHIRRNL